MKSKVGKALRNNILFGLFLITPIVVTGLLVYWLFSFFAQMGIIKLIVRLLKASLPKHLHDTQVVTVLLWVFTLLLILMTLFLIGFFVRSILGRRLYRLGDRALARIPVINKIYIWVRQISEAFVAQRQTMFKEVVLVQYPRKGVYAMAFVTAATPPLIHKAVTDDPEDGYVSLFVPTTPNPTSGVMVIARRSELATVNLSIAEAMKFIISAGAVPPGEQLEDDRPTLFDKLEAWLETKGETGKGS